MIFQVMMSTRNEYRDLSQQWDRMVREMQNNGFDQLAMAAKSANSIAAMGSLCIFTLLLAYFMSF